MDDGALPTPVEWCRQLISERVKRGAWVVDATAGNGFDTLLLAQRVGCTGRVFSFDIQSAAIEITRQRLQSAEGLAVCALIHSGHEHFEEYLPPEARGMISAFMFNLGWLPGHDKTCITRADTTLSALRKADDWLQPGGIITLVVYPNHEGGGTEAEAVKDWVSALSPVTYEARHMSSHYRPGLSPEAWAVRKRLAKVSVR